MSPAHALRAFPALVELISPAVPVSAMTARAPLPAPTGPRPVGQRELTLVDRHRHDPFAGGHRLLAVTLLYPTARVTGPAPRYLPAVIARGLGLPPTATAGHTDAHLNAPIAPGRHPLVLFSPGYATSRLLYQSLLGDLASRGCVVAAIDHTGETTVQLPGGRVIAPVLGPDDARRPLVSGTRVADLRFVREALLRDQRFARHIDARRVAALGHWFERLRHDARLARFAPRLRWPDTVFELPGAAHLALTDAPAFADLLGGTRDDVIGPLDPDLVLRLQREIVGGFLLRHHASPQ